MVICNLTGGISGLRRYVGGTHTAATCRDAPKGFERLAEKHGAPIEVDAGSAALAAGDREGAARALSDRMVNTFAIIGSPQECRERMAEYSSVVDWVALNTPGGGMPGSERALAVHRVIQSFGDK